MLVHDKIKKLEKTLVFLRKKDGLKSNDALTRWKQNEIRKCEIEISQLKRGLNVN